MNWVGGGYTVYTEIILDNRNLSYALIHNDSHTKSIKAMALKGGVMSGNGLIRCW